MYFLCDSEIGLLSLSVLQVIKFYSFQIITSQVGNVFVVSVCVVVCLSVWAKTFETVDLETSLPPVCAERS